MELIRRFLKGAGVDTRAEPPSAPFADTQGGEAHEEDDEAKSRNAQRRDMVRMVLRETMQRHGVPSDWLELRMLPSGGQRPGMHVQFLVRKGDHQLLGWIHAFQDSFWEQVLRKDSRARDWLFSVGWEFYGKSEHRMPDPQAWKGGGPPTDPMPLHSLPPPPAPKQAHHHDEALADDLAALQAAMSISTHPPAGEPGKKKPRG